MWSLLVQHLRVILLLLSQLLNTSLPQFFPTFFFLASLEFVTLFGLIKKLVKKKMENKLRRWGGYGSNFPGNHVKLNFNIVVIVVVVIHVVVVAVHIVVVVSILIIMKNKVIHVISWNELTFDFDLRYKEDNGWLKALLKDSFFETCELHCDCPKYGCNMYFLDCMNGALCTISI